MDLEIVVGLIPAAAAWATARWAPSHNRLLTQAKNDLALAEQLKRGPVAADLRHRAREATKRGLELRDSNDAGRTLAVFAAIAVLGTFGLPWYWDAVPQSVEGWRGPVMLVLWGIYALFSVAALIAGVWWLIKRPR